MERAAASSPEGCFSPLWLSAQRIPAVVAAQQAAAGAWTGSFKGICLWAVCCLLLVRADPCCAMREAWAPSYLHPWGAAPWLPPTLPVLPAVLTCSLQVKSNGDKKVTKGFEIISSGVVFSFFNSFVEINLLLRKLIYEKCV